MKMTDEQQKIVDTSGSIVVLASAGTGKTFTLVRKVFRDIEARDDHRCIAAVTFTQRAAQEIKSRLLGNSKQYFVNTINQFALQEIIIPFISDALHYSLEKDPEPCYDKNKRFKSTEELDEILFETGKICTYKDNDKNYIFELANRILDCSESCRLFLVAKYFKIFVDEYQDCDITMHNFFLRLAKDLNIDIVAFGDAKQFIYGWRGATRQAFSDLQNLPNISNCTLSKNYRSPQPIQNYVNALYPVVFSKLYVPCQVKDTVVLLYRKNSRAVEEIVKLLIQGKTTAILRYKNEHAKASADKLASLGVECKYLVTPPVSYIYSDESWLYYELARYFVAPHPSVYNIIEGAPAYLRDLVSPQELMKIIPSNYDYNRRSLERLLKDILQLFNYSFNMEYFDIFDNTILLKECHASFHPEDFLSVAMTVHASKGSEFDQVVLFAEDFSLISPDDIDMHYVAASRACQKLIIVCDDCNISYIYKIKQLWAESNIDYSKLVSVVTV